MSGDLVRRWQTHARALLEGEPRWVGAPQEFPVPASYIVLHLEYTPETKDVWLIGARVVKPGDGDVTFTCWSDRDGTIRALTALSQLINAHPDLPVVTYSGRSADLPMLRAAAERCDAERLLDALEERHLDLFNWMVHSLMLPTLDFGLKYIRDWTGIGRNSEVANGLAATVLYQRYLRTADPALRDQLLDYNREDVDGLVEVTEHLRSVVAMSIGQTYTHNQVVQVVDLVYETPFQPRAAPTRANGAPVRASAARRPLSAMSAESFARAHLRAETRLREREGLPRRSAAEMEAEYRRLLAVRPDEREAERQRLTDRIQATHRVETQSPDRAPGPSRKADTSPVSRSAPGAVGNSHHLVNEQARAKEGWVDNLPRAFRRLLRKAD